MQPALHGEEQRLLLRRLLENGAVLFGDVIHSRFGLHSPIYFDLRASLYSHPELLWSVGKQFAEKICELTRDDPKPQCAVGIPDTATPLALATALYSWQQGTRPAISYGLLRKEAKTYPGLAPSHWIGTRDPACEYNLLDDVVASGSTKRAAAAKMNAEGISPRRIIVLFDREQGDGLRNDGFELHGIFRVPEILDFYLQENLISSETHDKVCAFLRCRRFDSTPALKG